MSRETLPASLRRPLRTILGLGTLTIGIALASPGFGQSAPGRNRDSGANPPPSQGHVHAEPIGPLPDDRVGIRTAPLLLITRTDVQEDLGLSATQVKAALKQVEKLRAAAAGLKDMPPDQAVARRRAIDESELRWLEVNLSEAQRDRLGQIDLWWEGTSAFLSRPQLTSRLELTEAQSRDLKAAITKRNATRTSRGFDLEAERTLRREGLRILSQTQRERLHAILGKPFEPHEIAASNPRGTRR